MGTEILIAGAGQLGSRYLQGLSRYTEPLRIHVYDIAAESLERANDRWLECDPRSHAVVFTRDLNTVPQTIDVAIVATNADVRVNLVEQICRIASVRYWILEKVLAQRTYDLRRLLEATAASEGAWVNTPMYLWPLYAQLRGQTMGEHPVHAYFGGFRGLACNAIHYMDYVSRWNGCAVERVDTTGLKGSWVSTKRPGFYEVEGELTVSFSDGSTLVVAGSEEPTGLDFRVRSNDDVWTIDETNGVASSESGKAINLPILRQTELTAPLVERVLSEGRCDLPTVDVSVRQHEPLIAALVSHWNANMKNKLDHAPIT